MAMEQIPQEEKYIDFKVCCNIGNSYVNIGKYCNAIHNYEASISYYPDHKTGVNVLLFYVVLGDADKSKRCFTKIMPLTLNQVGEKEGKFTSEINNCRGG